jgi:prepilin-type N-terminal cleavage/methylation domain-containing protein
VSVEHMKNRNTMEWWSGGVMGGSASTPKGLRNKAQGCEERATLGHEENGATTPKGLCPRPDHSGKCRNPVGVESFFDPLPRVARASRLRFATTRHAQPWAEGRSPFGAGNSGLLSPCNPQSSILNPQSAFTLIELLVVIAIIAILAALVVGGAGVAVALSHKSRAQVELASLSAAIDAYKQKRGYYPPCNLSNAPTTPYCTTHSSLFYELTGTITTNLGSSQNFRSPLTQELLTQPSGGAGPTSVQWLFGTGGFNNSSPDPTEIQNFYPAMKNYQHGALYITDGSGPTYTLMVLSVHGPKDFPNGGSSQIYNFWHYVSSANAQPVHNRDTYDLWVDIVIRGKTNRISNWSKDPEIVNDWQD